VTVPDAAVIVLLPAATPVASPPALTVATAGLEDLQLTWFVKFRVLRSGQTPVAVNCSVVPTGIVEPAGVTAIDVKVVAGSTARTHSHSFPTRVTPR
jgi:hypothetical protein